MTALAFLTVIISYQPHLWHLPKVKLVCIETIKCGLLDNKWMVFFARSEWLSLCHSPPSIFLDFAPEFSLISQEKTSCLVLFWYILKQLFAAHQISTTVNKCFLVSNTFQRWWLLHYTFFVCGWNCNCVAIRMKAIQPYFPVVLFIRQ